VIVVVGVPGWRSGDDAGPDGPSARIALAAAAAGAAVELVGRVGDDRDGDDLLLALSRAGVGHAAVLRDPGRPTPRIAAIAQPDVEADPIVRDKAAPRSEGMSTAPRLDASDLELGLRYLQDYRVLVAADAVSDDALQTIVDASEYAGAHLVVVAAAQPTTDLLPSAATVLLRPPEDDGPFATLVGTYAAALDRGERADVAFRAAIASAGWESAQEDDPATTPGRAT
jgi:hypothetical protein